MKVPHGESPQLRKVAARARVGQGLENHAGSPYHDHLAAATGTNSNKPSRSGGNVVRAHKWLKRCRKETGGGRKERRAVKKAEEEKADEASGGGVGADDSIWRKAEGS